MIKSAFKAEISVLKEDIIQARASGITPLLAAARRQCGDEAFITVCEGKESLIVKFFDYSFSAPLDGVEGLDEPGDHTLWFVQLEYSYERRKQYRFLGH